LRKYNLDKELSLYVAFRLNCIWFPHDNPNTQQQLSHLYSQELGTAPKTLTITIEKGDVVNE